MTRALSIAREDARRPAESANTGTALMFGESAAAVRLVGQICEVAKRIWPKKTAAHLAACGQVSQRTAEYWMAGERGIAGESFVNLLWSEHGSLFLEAVMPAAHDARCPKYWRHRKRVQQIAAAKRESIEALKRIEQLEIEFAADD